MSSAGGRSAHMVTSPRTAAIPALLLALLLLPAAAGATPRYTAPRDGATTGACPVEAPCTLAAAAAGATAGDEIIVAAGDYDLETPLVLPAGVSITGAPGERPRLRATSHNTG